MWTTTASIRSAWCYPDMPAPWPNGTIWLWRCVVYGLMHRRQRSLHGEIRVEALAVHVYETVLLLAILLTFIYWMCTCVHRCIKSLNNIPPLCGTCQNDANLYCNYLKRQKRLNHVQVHFSFCSLSLVLRWLSSVGATQDGSRRFKIAKILKNPPSSYL